MFFAFSWHGRVPEGSRDRFKAPGDPPGQDFGRIFLKFYLKIWVDFHKHLQYFFALQPGNLILILHKIPFLQEKKNSLSLTVQFWDKTRNLGNLISFLQSVPPGSRRSLSGSAGMLPGSASNLSNPPAGVPLGYGDSRSGLNIYPNIYPNIN